MSLQAHIAETLHPPMSQSGDCKRRELTYDTVVILEEILDTLRKANSPWLTTNEAASYLAVCPSLISKWRQEKLITAYYGPNMGHPRYKRSELDQLMTTIKYATPRVR